MGFPPPSDEALRRSTFRIGERRRAKQLVIYEPASASIQTSWGSCQDYEKSVSVVCGVYVQEGGELMLDP